MIAILFFLYFAIGVQITLKPNRYIKLQFMVCLILSLLSFNLHSHLLRFL